MAYDQHSDYNAPQRSYYNQRAPTSAPYEQVGYGQENGQYGYDANGMTSPTYGGQYEQSYTSPPQTYSPRPQQPRAPPSQSQRQYPQQYDDVPAQRFQQSPQLGHTQAPAPGPTYQDDARYEQRQPRRAEPRQNEAAQQSQSYDRSRSQGPRVPASNPPRQVDPRQVQPAQQSQSRAQPQSQPQSYDRSRSQGPRAPLPNPPRQVESRQVEYRQAEPRQQAPPYDMGRSQGAQMPASTPPREAIPEKQSKRSQSRPREPARRKPLMECPDDLPLSQDNAFPIFPSKKEASKTKGHDNSGASSMKDRSSGERTRPSTANTAPNTSSRRIEERGQTHEAVQNRRPDASFTERAAADAGNNQARPPYDERSIASPPPAQPQQRVDRGFAQAAVKSPEKYTHHQDQRAQQHGQPGQPQQHSPSIQRGYRDAQQEQFNQGPAQHGKPEQYAGPEQFGRALPNARPAQRDRPRKAQPEGYGQPDYNSRAATDQRGRQEQHFQPEQYSQPTQNGQPSPRPSPRPQHEQWVQPGSYANQGQTGHPPAHGVQPGHFAQPQSEPYSDPGQYGHAEQYREPQQGGYPVDQYSRNSNQADNYAAAPTNGSGGRKQKPQPLQFANSPSATHTPLQSPPPPQQQYRNDYENPYQTGAGGMPRFATENSSANQPNYEEDSRYNSAREQQRSATREDQGWRQQAQPIQSPPLRSPATNDTMYYHKPRIDPGLRHESLGDVYADYLADDPPFPAQSAPAQRDAHIEANMPDFDSHDSRQAAHRRDRTIDQHLNDVHLTASSPPMPSSTNPQPVAYRKPVYQDPRALPSQPDLHAANAAQDGMSGFVFDVQADANNFPNDQYNQAPRGQRPQNQQANGPAQSQRPILSNQNQQSQRSDRSQQQPNWPDQNQQPQWSDQGQPPNRPDQPQQPGPGYDTRGPPANQQYRDDYAAQQRNRPVDPTRPRTAGPEVPSHNFSVGPNGQMNSQMQMRGPGQRPPPVDRAPSAPPAAPPGGRPFNAPLNAPIGRPGFQQASSAGPAPGRSQQQMHPYQQTLPQQTPPQQQQQQQPQRAANPDSLPHHPPPVRPGLMEQSSAPPSSRPPPVRQYNGASAPAPKPISTKSRTSTDDRQRPVSVPVPVTNAELDRLHAQADSNPGDHATGLILAKKLVEAASVLASDNGRLDPKATAKNRERFILDAHKRIKKLVNAGYPDAMFYLADCYGQGLLGLEVDTKEAFSLYQQAAKLNHAAAAYRTAVCCEMGPEEGGGTRKDLARAFQWYRRAAQLQDVAAMYKVGMISLKGLLGQQKNIAEAVTWLKRAAERADVDHPHALHQLGLLHEPGTTDPAVREKVIPDEGYARELFIQAANLGYKFSQARLGLAYEYGALGLPIDSRRSIGWYSKAAAQGEHSAELALSGWYLTGAEGILEHSDTEAYLWARKAASSEPPLAKAMFAMGYYTENGIGCPASLDEARKWYGRSASYKFPKAIERLEELRKGKSAKPGPNHGRLRRDQRRDESECVVM